MKFIKYVIILAMLSFFGTQVFATKHENKEVIINTMPLAPYILANHPSDAQVQAQMRMYEKQLEAWKALSAEERNKTRIELANNLIPVQYAVAGTYFSIGLLALLFIREISLSRTNW